MFDDDHYGVQQQKAPKLGKSASTKGFEDSYRFELYSLLKNKKIEESKHQRNITQFKFNSLDKHRQALSQNLSPDANIFDEYGSKSRFFK